MKKLIAATALFGALVVHGHVAGWDQRRRSRWGQQPVESVPHPHDVRRERQSDVVHDRFPATDLPAAPAERRGPARGRGLAFPA